VQKTGVLKNNKAQLFGVRLCYIDGLVSTGNQIPYTILKRIFANIKLFPKNFINIFFIAVDNGGSFFCLQQFFASFVLIYFFKIIFTKKNKTAESIDFTIVSKECISTSMLMFKIVPDIFCFF
jgi:hypothetical protein